MPYTISLTSHQISPATFVASSHFNLRPEGQSIDLIVLHNISLPPKQFAHDYITDLFLGRLDPTIDPYFQTIYQLQVSAHLLIRRDGSIIQYVPFDKRAWHAGVSNYQGRDNCNDFSIGIELEGADDIEYTPKQYQVVADVCKQLQIAYPSIAPDAITGHQHIAPGRKTDPGESFDWDLFYSLMKEI